MPEPPRVPLDLLASEAADLSPSLSLPPQHRGLTPGREAIEASLGALGAQAALALSFFGNITMPTVDVAAAVADEVAAGATPSAAGTGPDLSAPKSIDKPGDNPGDLVTTSTVTTGDVPGWTLPETAAGQPTSPPASPSTAPSTALARSYEPIEEIGSGGMGVVYRARQTVLHRDIAIKAARFSTDEARAIKFISEALLTASLEHPNIVPVHDLTTTPDQRLALAMKLVGGTTWRALLADGHSDLEHHLDILMSVANALAFAHSKHIIHCDIKPANVLIGEFGEVLLVDWGIALDFYPEKRPSSPAPHCSDLKSPCGTPQYIAPEQARGEGETLGPWTDIFLLGAVLYEILTGHPPHRGRAAAEVLWRAIEWRGPDFSRAGPDREPDHKIDREIPDSLAAICARAMAPACADRYQTVSEFQDDLRAFLDHRESLLISALAGDKLAACRARDEQVAVGDRQGRNQVYSEYADAVAGFREARVLWADNPQARAGEREARLAYARSALEHNDLGLAEAQLKMLEDGPGAGKDAGPDAGPDADKDAEVDALLTQVHTAQEANQRAHAHTRRLRTALAATAVIIIAGLAVAYLLIEREHTVAVKSRNLAERQLADIQRLADVQHVVALQEEYRTLWPAIPESAEAMDQWLAAAGELIARLPDHETYLQSLRKRGWPVAGKAATTTTTTGAEPAYRFVSATDQWEHDNLSSLVADIRSLRSEHVPGMTERVQFARTIFDRSIGDYRAAWQQASAAIASSELYRGLTIEPQIGLVPIGADPDSGLWEFAHIQSGFIPERGPDGHLKPGEDTAIVLVLLPGGSFSMGARRPSPNAASTDQTGANIDPRARGSEGPVHTIPLAPFFIGKYEMTQGQWQRFTDENPSAYPPGKIVGGNTHDARHPVEMVRWDDAFAVVTKLGLTLPTEAQWEYAARADTTTIYPTGDDKLSLRGALNIADAYCQEQGSPGSWRYETWLDDGYVVHAPVGSYRANRFGLHDVVGNVWEWCLDRYGEYTASVRPGTGERDAPADGPHVFRGGGFRASVVHARSADRYSLYAPAYRGYDVGLRPARALQR